MTHADKNQRTPKIFHALKSGPDTLRVLLGDRVIRMPSRLHDPMTFVRDHLEFEVSELSPWLDPGSRLVVVRRLVREGLLRIAT